MIMLSQAHGFSATVAYEGIGYIAYRLRFARRNWVIRYIKPQTASSTNSRPTVTVISVIVALETRVTLMIDRCVIRIIRRLPRATDLPCL